MVIEELAKYGINHTDDRTVVDGSCAAPIEKALERGQGPSPVTGSLRVLTGKYTGRSPHDRFIVDTPDVHDKIAWGNVNVPFSEEGYEKIRAEVIGYLSERRIFMVHALAGADRRYSRKVLGLCELASQALFMRQMLVRPTEEEMANFGDADFVVMAAPMLKLDPKEFGTNSEAAVLLNFKKHEILVVGTQYSGEIKKSIFSMMNYLLPWRTTC